MKVIKLEELVSHDVFEFCYSIRYPEHWNFDSVFVNDDEFDCLNFYLEQIIPNFKYYGEQKIKMEEWNQIKNLALKNNDYQEFFQAIDVWKQKDPKESESFWIYGV